MAGNFKLKRLDGNKSQFICTNYNNVASNGLTADETYPFVSKGNNTTTVIVEIQEVANSTTVEYNRENHILKASNFKEE